MRGTWTRTPGGLDVHVCWSGRKLPRLEDMELVERAADEFAHQLQTFQRRQVTDLHRWEDDGGRVTGDYLTVSAAHAVREGRRMGRLPIR